MQVQVNPIFFNNMNSYLNTNISTKNRLADPLELNTWNCKVFKPSYYKIKSLLFDDNSH